MKDEIDRCGNCLCFLPMGVNGGIDPANLKAPVQGMCRFNPPVSQIIGMVQHPMSPKGSPGQPQIARVPYIVDENEWCYQHKKIATDLGVLAWLPRDPAGKIIDSEAK